MNESLKRGLVLKVPTLLLALLAGTLFMTLTSTPAFAAEQAGSTKAQLAAGQLYSTVCAQSTTDAPPANKKSMYEVYSTYFFVNAGSNACAGCNLHLEYRQKIGNEWSDWKTFKSPLLSYTNYKVKDLETNKLTQVKLFYASLYTNTVVTTSKAVTFRTGINKKPGIKSAKVQAVNVVRHKQHRVSYLTGYVYKTVYDIWYTYKIKTTVTLKKPLKKGYLKINGTTFKAKGKNKGKRTFTVTTSEKTSNSSPRGSKYTVSVVQYQNKTWKGYTLLWQKDYKIK
ncbi:MAG: hypothetical protein IJI68_05905 [Eggerthellaceae bacterium]|nr:hypothetical protein [Eggerthellaceae bacterium]